MDAKQVWETTNGILMPQYGTSMHWPYCRQHDCTGCIPEAQVSPPKLDLSIFRTE